MSKKRELTWIKKSKRWVKKYQGRYYYFRFGEGKTDEAGYQQALAAWKQKKAELDASERSPHAATLDLAATKWEVVQDYLASHGEPELAKNRSAVSELLRALADYPAPLKQMLPDWVLDPSVPAPYLAEDPSDQAAASRVLGIAQVVLSRPDAVPETNLSLKHNARRFVQTKLAESRAGLLTAGRVETIRSHLDSFVAWAGESFHIDKITAAMLAEYKLHLLGLLHSKAIKSDTARDKLAIVVQFVRHLARHALCTLPANVGSTELQIRVSRKAIKVFEVAELTTLVKAANPRLRLYLQLMLNCGFQQLDIAELLVSEFDPKRCTITRKRGKTKDKSENVPTVSYKLWPATCKLLNEHRNTTGELLLTNEDGGRLVWDEHDGDDKYKKADNINSAYDRFCSKLIEADILKRESVKPLKLIRKTSATLLASHPIYGRFDQFFLGQAPQSIAEAHYSIPPQKLFDESLAWLGEQYGF